MLTAGWTVSSAAPLVLRGFQGGLMDVVTGNLNFQQRDYNPTTMTWTTQDPLGYVDGMNPYQPYTGNPTNRVDPTGFATGTQTAVLPGFGGAAVYQAMMNNPADRVNAAFMELQALLPEVDNPILMKIAQSLSNTDALSADKVAAVVSQGLNSPSPPTTPAPNPPTPKPTPTPTPTPTPKPSETPSTEGMSAEEVANRDGAKDANAIMKDLAERGVTGQKIKITPAEGNCLDMYDLKGNSINAKINGLTNGGWKEHYVVEAGEKYYDKITGPNGLGKQSYMSEVLKGQKVNLVGVK